jgi:hypothetical protein
MSTKHLYVSLGPLNFLTGHVVHSAWFYSILLLFTCSLLSTVDCHSAAEVLYILPHLLRDGFHKFQILVTDAVPYTVNCGTARL